MNVINCDACDNLREYAYEFATKGVTDTVCNSLKNDTGFNPTLTATHTDCEDLNDANDCLVGRMIDEVEAYESCDWKKFTKPFIKNLYNVLKAMICAICGIWTNIHGLWKQVRYLLCMVNMLAEGIGIDFKEDDFIPGEGVDFDRSAVPVHMTIKGNIASIRGSINIDRTVERWAKLGQAQDGSPIAGNQTNVGGGYTLCILRIKKSKYPWIKSIRTSVGGFTNTGCAQVVSRSWDEGSTFSGQWGYDSDRVTVPSGYIYVRVHISNLITWGVHGTGTSKAEVTFATTNMVDIDAGELC